jgi:CBS domain-containing protein
VDDGDHLMEVSMKVREFMTKDVQSCTETADLATVAKIMWDADCGIVPVVDDNGRVIGVITDRDICIAAATRSLDPASIGVREAMSRNVATCLEDAESRSALEALRERRIRRLPVVNRQNRLVGILSMSDLVTRGDFRQPTGVPGDELLNTLRAISAHPTAASA